MCLAPDCSKLESAEKNLGRGTVTAIALLEYNSGMQRARTKHAECVKALKSFWHVPGKMGPRALEIDSQKLEQMVQSIDTLQRVIKVAQSEYQVCAPSSSTPIPLCVQLHHEINTVQCVCFYLCICEKHPPLTCVQLSPGHLLPRCELCQKASLAQMRVQAPRSFDSFFEFFFSAQISWFFTLVCLRVVCRS